MICREDILSNSKICGFLGDLCINHSKCSANSINIKSFDRYRHYDKPKDDRKRWKPWEKVKAENIKERSDGS